MVNYMIMKEFDLFTIFVWSGKLVAVLNSGNQLVANLRTEEVK